MNDAEYVLVDPCEEMAPERFAAEIGRVLGVRLMPIRTAQGFLWYSGNLYPGMAVDAKSDDCGLESDPFPFAVTTTSVGALRERDEDRRIQKQVALRVLAALAEATPWRLAIENDDGEYHQLRPALDPASSLTR